MKFANPLYYPLAMLASGVTLVVGVRFAQIPNVAILPVAAVVATAGASWLKSREPETFNLDNPELAKELQAVRDRALLLADKAIALQLEATKLLTDSGQIELLATVQYVCDRTVELPAKIDSLARRLDGSNLLLSVKDLQQQLIAVQVKLQNSSGVAEEHLNQLAKSLQRNIELAIQGQDTRMAQIINLATLIQDAAGVLQELQNKLRSFDLSDAAQTMELRHICKQLGYFQENVDLLVSKSPN
ncbi:MAG TPA: hypothetical protein DEV81_18455 [Cyanobacteria bacterium UBA11049]|nr:hypothetical protein [Cyanobacteria bacterium UBA11049]